MQYTSSSQNRSIKHATARFNQIVNRTFGIKVDLAIVSYQHLPFKNRFV